MEKLLNTLVSRLSVRMVASEPSIKTWKGVSKDSFDCRDVSDSIKEIFKIEFDNQLYSKMQRMEVGESIVYGFDYDSVRPLGTLMEDANDNMAEVLLKLPALKDGESYAFPRDTYLQFTLIDKREENILITPVLSDWILEAYQRQ